jgi:hypothetical protein
MASEFFTDDELTIKKVDLRRACNEIISFEEYCSADHDIRISATSEAPGDLKTIESADKKYLDAKGDQSKTSTPTARSTGTPSPATAAITPPAKFGTAWNDCALPI